MPTLLDLDLHGSAQTNQLIGARIRHDSNHELWHTTIHCSRMLQHKASTLAMQRTRYAFDGDVAKLPAFVPV